MGGSRDILAMLRHEVLVEPSRPARLTARTTGAPSYVDLPPGWRVAEVPVPGDWIGRPLDVEAWRRARFETPLVVLRPTDDGGRSPSAPDGHPLAASDVVVVLGPTDAPPAK